MKKSCENCLHWSIKASGDTHSIGVCTNELTNQQVNIMSEAALARFFIVGDTEKDKQQNATVVASSLRFRNDFLCANYEMRFSPDWGNAPHWANYWAIDRSGDSFWYANKPALSRERWYHTSGNYVFHKLHGFEVKNWKNSLQSRPKEQE